MWYSDFNTFETVPQIKSSKGDANAVSIIEADVNVDFDAPADYVDPSTEAAAKAPTEIFIPDTEFSKKAAAGCVAIPKGYHLETGENDVVEGRTLGGKSKKKKKKVMKDPVFTGVQSEGGLVPEVMVIGDFSGEGVNSPFDFSFTAEAASTAMETDSAFEGVAGATLRKAK